MPIFKLFDKKDKSEKVVSGIRLTESKYINPNTARIDLKDIRKDERLGLSADELELPDEDVTQEMSKTPELAEEIKHAFSPNEDTETEIDPIKDKEEIKLQSPTTPPAGEFTDNDNDALSQPTEDKETSNDDVIEPESTVTSTEDKDEIKLPPIGTPALKPPASQAPSLKPPVDADKPVAEEEKIKLPAPGSPPPVIPIRQTSPAATLTLKAPTAADLGNEPETQVSAPEELKASMLKTSDEPSDELKDSELPTTVAEDKDEIKLPPIGKKPSFPPGAPALRPPTLGAPAFKPADENKPIDDIDTKKESSITEKFSEEEAEIEIPKDDSASVDEIKDEQSSDETVTENEADKSESKDDKTDIAAGPGSPLKKKFPMGMNRPLGKKPMMPMASKFGKKPLGKTPIGAPKPLSAFGKKPLGGPRPLGGLKPLSDTKKPEIEEDKLTVKPPVDEKPITTELENKDIQTEIPSLQPQVSEDKPDAQTKPEEEKSEIKFSSPFGKTPTPPPGAPTLRPPMPGVPPALKPPVSEDKPEAASEDKTEIKDEKAEIPSLKPLISEDKKEDEQAGEQKKPESETKQEEDAIKLPPIAHKPAFPPTIPTLKPPTPGIPPVLKPPVAVEKPEIIPEEESEDTIPSLRPQGATAPGMPVPKSPTEEKAADVPEIPTLKPRYQDAPTMMLPAVEKGIAGLPSISKEIETTPEIAPEDDLQGPTAKIPAYERADKAPPPSRIEEQTVAKASLYCFFKIAGTWQRKHYLSTDHGVRIGGANSLHEITLNDEDLDKIQVVIIEIGNKWLVMDIGEKDMMRVDGSASRQIDLKPNLPFVLQIGSEPIIAFLSNMDNTPELIPAEKKPDAAPGAMLISKIKFGEKEFPIHIPEKIPEGESKEITSLPTPGFTLTPTHDPDKVLAALEIPASDIPLHVGRSSKMSDLLVNDKNVSRQHSKITAKNKVLIVEDCETSNGTYVNSEEISGQAKVHAGDIITFGSIPFIVSFQ